MKRFICLVFCLLFVSSATVAVATSQSPNYSLDNYSFGSGGTTPDTQSNNNKLYGNTGEPESDPESDNYEINGGAAGQSTTSTPLTPTLENLYNNYDRLKFTLDPGTDPSDTQYAIAISEDDFVTTKYISSALTLTNSLSSGDWQTYTAWGGASGNTVTGLTSNKTYKIKVKAVQGEFSESAYSPTAEADTDIPSLTFSTSGGVNLGNLSQSNSFTATSNTTLTTSTNAFNGYNIYAFITGPMTMQGGSATIANYAGGSYASPSSWASGTGFGYTSNDTTINNVAKWNASPCPGDSGTPLCYAPFSQTGPGDVVADHELTLTGAPISNEQFTVSYKLVTDASQPAGSYLTTVVYTIAPIY